MAAGHVNQEQQNEVDRLLRIANVRRMRNQWVEAEEACRKALAIYPTSLDAREILGDVLYECGKLDEARSEYHTALESDRDNPSVEKKYAKMSLEIGERERQKAIAQDMLDNPKKYTVRERKPGRALLLSLIPGMGQFYNGDIVKALVIWGTLVLFAASWWVQDPFRPGMRTVAEFLQSLHEIVLLTGLLSLLAYIYGLIDAPISASKSSQAAKDQIE